MDIFQEVLTCSIQNVENRVAATLRKINFNVFVELTFQIPSDKLLSNDLIFPSYFNDLVVATNVGFFDILSHLNFQYD